MFNDLLLYFPGFTSPVCDLKDPQVKRGINCIIGDQVQNAINLLNSIRPELLKRSVAHRCFDPTIKPQMTEAEIITFCRSNYGIKEETMIKNDLRNLEVMTFSNPEWGLSVAQTEKNDGAVIEENLAKNMVSYIVDFCYKRLYTFLIFFRNKLFSTLTER